MSIQNQLLREIGSNEVNYSELENFYEASYGKRFSESERSLFIYLYVSVSLELFP